MCYKIRNVYYRIFKKMTAYSVNHCEILFLIPISRFPNPKAFVVGDNGGVNRCASLSALLNA